MYSYACNDFDNFSMFLYHLSPKSSIIVVDLDTRHSFSRSAKDLFYDLITSDSSLYEYRNYSVTSFYNDVNHDDTEHKIILGIRRK